MTGPASRNPAILRAVRCMVRSRRLSSGRILEEIEPLMDDKTLTAVSTSLALMQIQINALLLLLERQSVSDGMRAEFQRLISEGVQAVGVETMESIKTRIKDGILQQEIEGFRSDGERGWSTGG